MAAAPHFPLPHQPLEEMMTNLKVVHTSSQIPSSVKEGSPLDAASCISAAGDAVGSVREGNLDHDSVAPEQHLSYQTGAHYGYYYPGYDGSFWELDDQGYYVAGDGIEPQCPVIQAENGSLIALVNSHFQLAPCFNHPLIPLDTIPMFFPMESSFRHLIHAIHHLWQVM